MEVDLTPPRLYISVIYPNLPNASCGFDKLYIILKLIRTAASIFYFFLHHDLPSMAFNAIKFISFDLLLVSFVIYGKS